jgi:hypothetical protein
MSCAQFAGDEGKKLCKEVQEKRKKEKEAFMLRRAYIVGDKRKHDD